MNIIRLITTEGSDSYTTCVGACDTASVFRLSVRVCVRVCALIFMFTVVWGEGEDIYAPLVLHYLVFVKETLTHNTHRLKACLNGPNPNPHLCCTDMHTHTHTHTNTHTMLQQNTTFPIFWNPLQ